MLADGRLTPANVTDTLQGVGVPCAKGVQVIVVARPDGGAGCVVGSVTTTDALEEDVTLDDTVAMYVPALPYACEIENAVD